MVRVIIFLIVIIFPISLSSLEKSKEPEYFNKKLSFSFNPPNGWKQMDSGNFENYINNLRGKKTFSVYKIEPIEVFVGTDNSGACFLSGLKSKKFFAPKDIVDIYIKDTKAHFSNSSITENDFVLNRLYIRMMRVSTTNQVLLRMLISPQWDHDKIFQMDYLLPFTVILHQSLSNVLDSVNTFRYKNENE